MAFFIEVQFAKLHIIVCDLSGYTIFFHIFSWTARFSKKEVTEHKMCVFVFSADLSQTFLNLIYIKNQRDATWQYVY